MSDPIISVRHLTKTFDSYGQPLTVFADICCDINRGDVISLIGPSGTGKSTFLRHICSTTKKKHVVLAPTGIAAINAGGSTMHSFFHLPFHPLVPVPLGRHDA